MAAEEAISRTVNAGGDVDNNIDDGFSELSNEGVPTLDPAIVLPPSANQGIVSGFQRRTTPTVLDTHPNDQTHSVRQFRVLNSSVASARNELQFGLDAFVRDSGLAPFAQEGGMYERRGMLSDDKVAHLLSKSREEPTRSAVSTQEQSGTSLSSSRTSSSFVQVTNPHPKDRLKRFAETWGEDPRALKQMRFSGTWTQPQDPKNKGLRHFAMKVCQKVQEKGVTSYNEVADELVAEMFGLKGQLSQASSEQLYDQKNVRRRIYDALNVLMAVNIICKDKKEIKWIGLPTNSAQELQNLEIERQNKLDRISQKKAQLQELLMQHVAFKNLVKQNKEFEAANGGHPPEDNSVIKLPFVVISTSEDTDIDCSIASDRREYLFNFDRAFEVMDDVQILKKLGLCLGLDNPAPVSQAHLDAILSNLPKSLHHYVQSSVKTD